VSSVAIDDDIE